MGHPRPLDPDWCQRIVTSPYWEESIERAPDGCHLWTRGSLTPSGYARPSIEGRVAPAHRIALVAALGQDLAPGAHAGHVCHDQAVIQGLCGNRQCTHRRCVNPEHLAEQSAAVNAQVFRSEVCPQGHPLVGPDADLVPSQLRRGVRQCAVCHRQVTAERNALVGEAARVLGVPRREYIARFGSGGSAAREILAGNAYATRPVAVRILVTFTARGVVVAEIRRVEDGIRVRTIRLPYSDDWVEQLDLRLSGAGVSRDSDLTPQGDLLVSQGTLVVFCR